MACKSIYVKTKEEFNEFKKYVLRATSIYDIENQSISKLNDIMSKLDIPLMYRCETINNDLVSLPLANKIFLREGCRGTILLNDCNDTVYSFMIVTMQKHYIDIFRKEFGDKFIEQCLFIDKLTELTVYTISLKNMSSDKADKVINCIYKIIDEEIDNKLKEEYNI